MSYPSSLDSFTTKVDNVDTVMASDVDGLQTAVIAIETFLGTSTASLLNGSDVQLGTGGVTTLNPAGVVYSGTYTPTLTNTTNVAASTPYVCQYMRVGNVVTVSGVVAIDVTSAAATVLGVSLPIASNFASNINGSGVASTIVNETAALLADSITKTMLMKYTAVATANTLWYFQFTYQII